MSITQFAMVEELASLIKDNLPSKHLLLAVEEALVNYLKDDPSSDGILELEPMSSYNRLILHRLADIFGFAHESIGEGDDRHLVLQRCLETSVPPILVSDILWQHDSCESPPMPYQLLRRDDSSSVLKINVPASPNFFEREAAYMAARERIFGMEEVDMKEASRQKPRLVPVVARRMISHALGQRINQCSQVTGNNSRHTNDPTDVCEIERRIEVNFDLHQKSDPDSSYGVDKNVRHVSQELNDANYSPSANDEKLSHKAPYRRSSIGSPGSGIRDGLHTSTARMREENLGAAKRIFAHALGKQASKDAVPRCRNVKGIMD